jgi:hypothetical protein
MTKLDIGHARLGKSDWFVMTIVLPSRHITNNRQRFYFTVYLKG